MKIGNSGTFGTHVLSLPNGKYEMVGDVPFDCAFKYKDDPARPISAEDKKTIQHCGSGFVKNVSCRVFDSEQEAVDFYHKVMKTT